MAMEFFVLICICMMQSYPFYTQPSSCPLTWPFHLFFFSCMERPHWQYFCRLRLASRQCVPEAEIPPFGWEYATSILCPASERTLLASDSFFSWTWYCLGGNLSVAMLSQWSVVDINFEERCDFRIFWCDFRIFWSHFAAHAFLNQPMMGQSDFWQSDFWHFAFETPISNLWAIQWMESRYSTSISAAARNIGHGPFAPKKHLLYYLTCTFSITCCSQKEPAVLKKNLLLIICMHQDAKMYYRNMSPGVTSPQYSSWSLDTMALRMSKCSCLFESKS